MGLPSRALRPSSSKPAVAAAASSSSSPVLMRAAVMRAAAARAAVGATRPPSSLMRNGGGSGPASSPLPTPTLLRRARSLTAKAGAASSSSSTENLYTGPPRVCILGGGFGGLYTAVKLEALLWPRGSGVSSGSTTSTSSSLKPRVTLVDKGDRFVFKPLLYELLNGGASAEEVAPTFAQLLAPYDVRFVRARVAAVEEEDGADDKAATTPLQPWRAGEPRRAAGRVVLDSGESVEYDYLVVALGAEADARGVPGVRERAVPFVSLDDALRVKATLEQRVLNVSNNRQSQQQQQHQPTVVVVGAGYSGVELATVLAERVRAETAAARRGGGGSSATQLSPPPRVQLVTPGADILEGSPVGQREAARRALSSLGVEVLTGVRVAKLGPAEDGEGEAASDSDGNGNGGSAQPLTPCTVHYEASSSSSSSSSSAWKQRADLVVWTAGSAPVTSPAAAAASSSSPSPSLPLPFPTTPRGTVATEPSLRVIGHPRVFALGDTATATEESSWSASAGPVGDPDDPARRTKATATTAAPPPLPATAQVAFQQADYAAWNLWASITGRPLLPFRYQHLGSMMALGAAQAAVALPVELPADVAARVKGSPLGPLLALAGVRVGDGVEDKEDKAGVTIEGPLAQLLRRGAYLYRQPTGEQRLAVAASWLQQAAAAAAAAVASSGSSSSSSRGR